MESSEASDPVPTGPRLTGSEAIKVHLTLAVVLALCTAAFYFELRRALGGNSLSWAYVFEWPMFAVFAGYMWWVTLHGNRRRRRRPPTKPQVAPEHVEMLKAWQEHLRQMAAAEAEAAAADPSPEAGR